MYLSNKELYVEIIISKAKGSLTRDAEKMLQLLGKRAISNMSYRDDDDRLDCLQSGLLDMYDNWYNFDEERTRNPFAYFTEVFKRGMAKGWNELVNKKAAKGHDYTVYSIESTNDGSGMYNF